MKSIFIILISIFSLSPLLAFDFGSLKEKTKSETEEKVEAESTFDLQAVRGKVESVFNSASPEVKDALKAAFDSYAEKKDLKMFDHLETLQEAELSSSQTVAWNKVKTDLMAAVLQRNFSFENTKNSELFNQSLSALKSGDLDTLKSAYSKLKKSVSLTREQKKIFQGVLDYAAPIKNSTTEGLKSLFGG